MAGDTPYTRTFIRAIETLGDIERLATALGTSVTVVELWVAGRANPPPSVFLRAIDIVADGGVVPRGRTGTGSR
jgi:DNA-binding transcriptional regulator YdaS (Cro superfamily)